MVCVYTGSFRGVRDQPVTDHEGLIPADVRHIRRVFAPYSAQLCQRQLRALGHVPTYVGWCRPNWEACGHAPSSTN
jgi:hypothetical protein